MDKGVASAAAAAAIDANKMGILNPTPWISFFGFAFLVVSVTGLVIGIFELAFNNHSDTLFIRMALHVVFIPMGAYISKLQTVPNVFNLSVQAITLEMFSLAGIIVGCIGLLLGSVELAFIPVSSYLIKRLAIYTVCLTLGSYFK